MKRLITVCAMLLVTVAVATATDLNRIPYPILGSANTAIYEIGPLGTAVTKLTVANKAINLSNYIMYQLVIPASLTTCQIRTSATAPGTGYGTNQAIIYPAGLVVKQSVNPTTPFANLSGCTNAFIAIQ